MKRVTLRSRNPRVVSSTLAMLVTTLVALFTTTCSPGNLTIGIRWYSDTLPTGAQFHPEWSGTGPPIPGVINSGGATNPIPGSQTQGYDHSFGGITNSNGISDYPNAVTGYYWNFTGDWTLTEFPGCAVRNFYGQPVPYPYAQVDDDCVL